MRGSSKEGTDDLQVHSCEWVRGYLLVSRPLLGDLFLGSAVKNSKCCFWRRLQRNAPFISLLNWTEVGLK